MGVLEGKHAAHNCLRARPPFPPSAAASCQRGSTVSASCPPSPQPPAAARPPETRAQVETLRDFGADNPESLAVLLWAFFEYWAWRHDYSADVVSVRTGGFLRKEDKDWTRRVGNERHLVRAAPAPARPEDPSLLWVLPLGVGACLAASELFASARSPRGVLALLFCPAPPLPWPLRSLGGREASLAGAWGLGMPCAGTSRCCCAALSACAEPCSRVCSLTPLPRPGPPGLHRGPL